MKFCNRIAFDVTVSDPSETYVIGRNGCWKTQGVSIQEQAHVNTVALCPIGKQGILRAGFSLPLEDMDRLCTTWLKERGKIS